MKDKWEKVVDGFKQLGLSIVRADKSQCVAVCPDCDKPKFYFDPESGCWDCKVCQSKGNANELLKRRHEVFKEAGPRNYAPLIKNREVLTAKSLSEFEIGYNYSEKCFTIPMYLGESIVGIQRYYLSNTGKNTSVALSGAGVFKPGLFQRRNTSGVGTAFIVEGAWDACALSQMLADVKADIYGLNGAGGLSNSMLALFEGRDVVVALDNDNGGREGAKRCHMLLDGIAKSVRFVVWPDKYTKKIDVRALLIRCKGDAAKAMRILNKYISSERALTDDERKKQTQDNTGKTAKEPVKTLIPLNRAGVLSAYRKWLELESDAPIDVLFGTIYANRFNLDPLWMFFVDSPGGGKTVLVESVSECDGVRACSVMTPQALISGAQTSRGDPSLIKQLNGKVLAVKDFTPILSLNSTQRDEIFSILRDAYDGRIEKTFGNGITRRYKSKFGIIAGVTQSIDEFTGNSVMGERFLRYRIKHKGASIRRGAKIVTRVLDNIGKETTMRAELSEAAARALTRSVTELPELNQHVRTRLQMLGHWVSALRGSVSRDKFTNIVYHKPVQEVGTRLTKQLASLAIGISAFRQTPIDDDILDIVGEVARDTLPDKIEEVVKQMYINQVTSKYSDGFDTSEIAEWTRFPELTIIHLMQDLCMLKVAHKQQGKSTRYKLSNIIAKQIADSGVYRKEHDYATQVFFS